MPSSEVKQRKKASSPLKQNEDAGRTTKQSCEKHEMKVGGKPRSAIMSDAERSSGLQLEMKTSVCLLSAIACMALAWLLLQQNARFSVIEEKYTVMYKKTEDFQELYDKISKVSKKLDSSDEYLLGTLTSMSLVGELEQEIAELQAAILLEQDRESSDTLRFHLVSMHFHNVTEALWGKLEGAEGDVGTLRAESRAGHVRMAVRVNEADTRLRASEERLEELEESTQQNMRALVHTEEDDVLRVREQLEWNIKQIQNLEAHHRVLSKRDEELWGKLEELRPREQWCEGQLPAVEEALHSILRLSTQLSGVQQRAEELSLWVGVLEDRMLMAASGIRGMWQALEDVRVENSLLEMFNEQGVVREETMGLVGGDMVDQGPQNIWAENARHREHAPHEEVKQNQV